MKTSANGLTIIKAFEGCHRAVSGRPGYFKAYIDPVGVLTIGHGHTNHHPPKFDSATVWSQAECDRVLASDLGTFERHVESLAKVPLAQHEFDALVSWAFNTGGPKTASLWKALNAGDKAAVPGKLAAWNKGGGRVLPGLTRRRKAEGLLWQGRFAEAFSVAGVKAPVADHVADPVELEPTRVPPPSKPSPAAETAGTVAAGSAVATAAAAGGADLWIIAAIIVAALAAGFIVWKIRKG